MKDVNFHTNDGGFNFRVAAYVTCGDKMLIQHADDVDFVNLVGGRVHLGESTVDAIKREAKEELGIDVKKPKLWLLPKTFLNGGVKKLTNCCLCIKLNSQKNF